MAKVKSGRYRHFKGKPYLVIGTVKHSETLEEMVLYVSLYENPRSQIWVRPKKMFLEKVEHQGQKVPRFRYIDED